MSKRAGPTLVVATVACLVGLAVATGSRAAPGEERGGRVWVQAHRGYSELYPENTLRAIREAVDAGADMIEVDLHVTADGHVVLMHDDSVDRTTDGQGRVEWMALDEIKRLDAGSWKAPEFAGERVPSLAEVLDLVRGRATLNLELKSFGRPWGQVERVVPRAVEDVRRHGAMEWVVFSSFDFRALDEVRKHAPEARLMLIDWMEPSSRFDGIDLAIERGFWGWTTTRALASEARVRKAKDAGLFVQVGVGASLDVEDLISWGVDCLSTDDPGRLITHLREAGWR